MTHTCTNCHKSAPAVKFSKQDGSEKLRSMCNLCRNARDRLTRQAPPPPRDYGSAWANLCADCRPNWSDLR